MALRKLSTAEMVEQSGNLLKKASAERHALEAVPAAKALIPSLERAHRALLAAQPPGNSAIAKLTEELTRLDVRHDDLVRGLDDRLLSEIELTTSVEVERELEVLRVALFPEGRSVVQRSYTEQAGEARLRAVRVTPAMRKTLLKLKCLDATTLDEHYDALQQTAADIAGLEQRRVDLAAESTEVGRNSAARNQWIRVIHAIAAVLEAAEVDEAPILGRVRAAEGKAERARGGGTTEPTPEPDPAPPGPTLPPEPTDPES